MNNYRVTITYQAEGGVFVARAPELRDCSVQAPTRAEVIALIEAEIEDRVGNMQAQGIEIPAPLDEQALDGALALTVTPELTRDLLFQARAAGVELEVLLTEILARAVARSRPPGKGGGRPARDGQPREREGQGQRYHDIMENRADFIEYVRSLDQGGGQYGGRRGGRRGKR